MSDERKLSELETYMVNRPPKWVDVVDWLSEDRPSLIECAEVADKYNSLTTKLYGALVSAKQLLGKLPVTTPELETMEAEHTACEIDDALEAVEEAMKREPPSRLDIPCKDDGPQYIGDIKELDD